MLKPVEQLPSFKYISIQVKVVVADTNRRFVNVYTKTDDCNFFNKLFDSHR